MTTLLLTFLIPYSIILTIIYFFSAMSFRDKINSLEVNKVLSDIMMKLNMSYIRTQAKEIAKLQPSKTNASYPTKGDAFLHLRRICNYLEDSYCKAGKWNDYNVYKTFSLLDAKADELLAASKAESIVSDLGTLGCEGESNDKALPGRCSTSA
jgi:hypothetical protein